MQDVATEKELQIVMTAGAEDPATAVLALECALVSRGAGVSTFLFFTQRATQWTCKLAARRGLSERVLKLLEEALASAVQVEACSACIEKFCLAGGDETVETFLRPEIRPSGLAVLVSRSVRGVSTLTF